MPYFILLKVLDNILNPEVHFSANHVFKFPMKKTILQVSQITGLSIATIRYYDHLGLLPDLKRNASGYRIFTQEDMSNLELIRCFRAVKIPIKQIKSMVETEQLTGKVFEKRLQTLSQQEQKLREYRDDIEVALLAIKIKIARYSALTKDTNSYDHGEEHIVNYLVELTKKNYQSEAHKWLSGLFSDLMNKNVKPNIFLKKDKYINLYFKKENTNTVLACFKLLSNLKY
ncbi:MerR family transcription regulator [Oenococcus kitaharae DSM 17330]|uniref:MerR family transcription regulator n=2 Tax=Oenococcus kitaharae TaxID=336988 RepID=G9WHU8_9LACO|nr:MerR family transcription regulator [Oenococcus kitaharae DSM 17330]